MKKILNIALSVVVLATLSACGNTKIVETDNTEVNAKETSVNSEVADVTVVSDEGAATVEVKFTDALGREVSVSKPKRVVTLLGSFCDEWLLAGGTVVGTASDSFTSFELSLDESVEDIGSHMTPDVEKIIELNPDFVIASSYIDAQVELLDTLENAGITVAYFYINNFDDYLASLEIFTDITGRKDLYETNGLEVYKQIEQAKEKIDGSKPTVLFIRAAATSVKVKGSEGTVGGEILADLDTINIADSEGLLEDISMEAIILADPDFIFVTTQGSKLDAALENVNELMISNPAWESLKAVQNGNYYVIDKALYNSKPNARWGEAYQKLADILYPEN